LNRALGVKDLKKKLKMLLEKECEVVEKVGEVNDIEEEIRALKEARNVHEVE